ncbi:hypothetical protein CK203_103440 [Vitis vinifera]|uniref:Retrotransposon Copia-like N-terminal domain-containing protein n=1 Tax=Vitis vinifera TaxID=29760 RepID=A0A438D789_VITVI|nr:hypothetical protein CK203_103440 [Vitis vinifera]
MATSSSSSSPLPLNTMVHMLTIKLTSSNYLLWRNQFIPLLTSQDLLGFLDGSVPAPSPKVIGSNSITQVNPAYTSWLTTDQTLLNLLYSSLTKESMNPRLENSNSKMSFNDAARLEIRSRIFSTLQMALRSTGGNWLSHRRFESPLVLERLRPKSTKSRKPKPSTASTSKSSPSSLVYCQICDKEGYLAKRYWTFLNLKKKQSANLAEAFAACSIPDSNDSEWYLDFGATPHLTNDPDGVDVPTIYSGNEWVMDRVIRVVLGVNKCENGLYVLDQNHHALASIVSSNKLCLYSLVACSTRPP